MRILGIKVFGMVSIIIILVTMYSVPVISLGGKNAFFILSSLDLLFCTCVIFFVDRNWGETFYVCGDCFILCASLVDDCTQREVYNFFVSGYE